MDFVRTVDDPEIYTRRSRKPNGEDYYELLIVYVYDILFCFHNPQLIMDALALEYDMKDGSVGPPNIYLGDEIRNIRSGINCVA